MALGDFSLASAMEAWIVNAIAQIPEFLPANGGLVEVYPGSTAPDGERVARELAKNRSPYACVLFVSDDEVPLEEGESAWDATYLVMTMVRNLRRGAARAGENEPGPLIVEESFKGVNTMRDLLRATLHNQHPDVVGKGYFADAVRYAGTRVVWEGADAYMLESRLIVRESVSAV